MMTNTQNPSPTGGATHQNGSSSPVLASHFPAGISRHPAPPHRSRHGRGIYKQPGRPYPQAPWQGAVAPIQTYLVPAILVTLFCFLPTGIAAIVYATQVSSKRDAGDYIGAGSGFEAGTYVDNRQPRRRSSGPCHRGDCRRSEQRRQQ